MDDKDRMHKSKTKVNVRYEPRQAANVIGARDYGSRLGIVLTRLAFSL